MITNRLARLAILVGMVLGSACSTPRPFPNSRQGLIDRWDGKKTPLARVDRTPPPFREENSIPISPSESAEGTPDTVEAAVRNWIWPLHRVSMTSPFGKRGRRFHEGVDLGANVGTDVFAVDEGEVLYSGSRIRGYGRIVILKHPSGLVTIYGHTKKNLVTTGQKVVQGQKIALSGRSGRARGPHLHFEIRKGLVAYDPMRLLAQSVRTASLAGPKR